jgi:hypothetical protein
MHTTIRAAYNSGSKPILGKPTVDFTWGNPSPTAHARLQLPAFTSGGGGTSLRTSARREAGLLC